MKNDWLDWATILCWAGAIGVLITQLTIEQVPLLRKKAVSPPSSRVKKAFLLFLFAAFVSLIFNLWVYKVRVRIYVVNGSSQSSSINIDGKTKVLAPGKWKHLYYRRWKGPDNMEFSAITGGETKTYFFKKPGIYLLNLTDDVWVHFNSVFYFTRELNLAMDLVSAKEKSKQGQKMPELHKKGLYFVTEDIGSAIYDFETDPPGSIRQKADSSTNRFVLRMGTWEKAKKIKTSLKLGEKQLQKQHLKFKAEKLLMVKVKNPDGYASLTKDKKNPGKCIIEFRFVFKNPSENETIALTKDEYYDFLLFFMNKNVSSKLYDSFVKPDMPINKELSERIRLIHFPASNQTNVCLKNGKYAIIK